MSNALYDKGRESFAKAEINWVGDTCKCALVDGNYTPNLATDQYWSSVSSHKVGTPQVIANPTDVAGVCDGDDVTFSAVTGNVVTYLVIYKDTGVEGTSRLIACIDTATGLPATPGGGDITVTWSNGTNKIFKL